VSTANRAGPFGVVVRLVLAVLRNRCAGFAARVRLAADTSALDGFPALVCYEPIPINALGLAITYFREDQAFNKKRDRHGNKRGRGRLASSAQPPRATSIFLPWPSSLRQPQPTPSSSFLDKPGALLEGLRCFTAFPPLPRATGFHQALQAAHLSPPRSHNSFNCIKCLKRIFVATHSLGHQTRHHTPGATAALLPPLCRLFHLPPLLQISADSPGRTPMLSPVRLPPGDAAPLPTRDARSVRDEHR